LLASILLTTLRSGIDRDAHLQLRAGLTDGAEISFCCCSIYMSLLYTGGDVMRQDRGGDKAALLAQAKNREQAWA